MQYLAQQATVPTYKLFGEQTPWPTPEMLHCESIATRSALHNWQITPHRHSGLFQILYLAGGSAEVQADGAISTLQANQLILVPQMCIHGFSFQPNAEGYVVTLAYPLIRKLAGSVADALVGLSTPIVFSLRDSEAHLSSSFEALDTEYRGARSHRSQLVEALLTVILMMLSRRCNESENPSIPGRRDDCFSAFCELVEKHYAEHKPVSFYANRLGVTAPHLNAICRHAVSRTGLELIHERVILEAKRNLIYTSMTIGLVADMAGFADPAYFTRFFKREVGMSPREFRISAGTLQP